MFIVWSGFGFIAVILAFGFGALGEAVLQPAIDHLHPGLPSSTGLAIGLVFAAVANWFAGQWLNGQPGRELIDPKTNQRVILRRNHTLFWIPIQYISALMLIAAVVVVLAPPADKLERLNTDAKPDTGTTREIPNGR